MRNCDKSRFYEQILKVVLLLLENSFLFSTIELTFYSFILVNCLEIKLDLIKIDSIPLIVR
ncbi:hypothetical protein LEP1GSC043_2453 [Leptospira weilii str. Ecochallenge]|uniref:Uncharacterized protein n=1 Tax=Leptospira weilii str. Ecochallenge TaxID=1049986 RepID=N1TXR8_9LEPT|nr:hypothetical protein LEP1GSC043_2453 [Leptospira weilii str. Ecochallenge]